MQNFFKKKKKNLFKVKLERITLYRRLIDVVRLYIIVVAYAFFAISDRLSLIRFLVHHDV